MLRIILLFVQLTAATASAVELYATGFENFTPGQDRIAGAPATGSSSAIPATDGWSGTHAGQDRSGIYAETSHAVSGIGNAAYLGGSTGSITTGGSAIYVRKVFNYDPVAAGNEVVTLRLLIGVKDSSGASRDNFEFLIYNNNSLGGGAAGAYPLAGIQFDNSQINPQTGKPYQTVYRYSWDPATGTLRYFTTGFTFFNDILQWLELRINHRTNRWSATLDTAPLFSDLPYYAGPNALNFGSILVQCRVSNPQQPGSNYILFDDLHIRADSLATFRSPEPTMIPGSGFQLRWFQEAGYTYSVQQYTLANTWTNAPGFAVNPAESTGFSGLFLDTATFGIRHRLYRVTRTGP